MSAPGCLFVLSADFGEYATANVLSRGQPIRRRFALPAQLAPYAAGGAGEAATYSVAEDIDRIVDAERPDAVILASGYLYAINNLFGPEALARLIGRLRARGIALATTDPWLRIWSLRPQTRFAIHSVRRGGIDAAQSQKVFELQQGLEAILKDLPHLFAVPMPESVGRSAFNPAFAQGARTRRANEWLFVISREDLALLGSPEFFRTLGARLEELLALPENRLRFIGPPALGRFLAERFPSHERVAFEAFSGFEAFERAVAGAAVVVYWNVLSASLLYCLYYGVPPVFFGKGHQATVCPGLYEHVVEHVYGGRTPKLLDPERPLAPRAGELAQKLGLQPWLAGIRADYARLPSFAEVLKTWLR